MITDWTRRFGVERVVGPVALAALLLGCADTTDAEVSDDEIVALGEQDLAVKTSVIWQQLSIPVCWENPDAASSTQRDWVKSAVTNAWQTASQVRFTGWGTCSSGAGGVRLQVIGDDNSNTGAYSGRELDGVPNGVKLNLNMAYPQGYADCVGKWGQERCVRGVTVHEFGHVLGFKHEPLRADNTNWDCYQLIGDPMADVYVGTYDKSSIMRSCTIMETGLTGLSSGDTVGVRAFYGTPSSSAFRKDAIGWDGESYYFLFGSKITRYSVSTDRAATKEISTPIGVTFAGWPTTSPWTSGVDAAVDFSSDKIYMFSGNGYLRISKSTMTVDSGYPKSLPGGFSNWPSTWTSVGAAIKWSNGKIYLFRGSEYVRLTGTRVDDGYPLPINGNWNIGFTSDIDYAFLYPNGKAYFFKGNQYTRVTTSPRASASKSAGMSSNSATEAVSVSAPGRRQAVGRIGDGLSACCLLGAAVS